MKRGFEENVPKVRPRVRVGRALDEQVAQARELAATESAEATLAAAADPQLEIAALAPATEPQPGPAVAGQETHAPAVQSIRPVGEPERAAQIPRVDPAAGSTRRSSAGRGPQVRGFCAAGSTAR